MCVAQPCMSNANPQKQHGDWRKPGTRIPRAPRISSPASCQPMVLSVISCLSATFPWLFKMSHVLQTAVLWFCACCSFRVRVFHLLCLSCVCHPCVLSCSGFRSVACLLVPVDSHRRNIVHPSRLHEPLFLLSTTVPFQTRLLHTQPLLHPMIYPHSKMSLFTLFFMALFVTVVFIFNFTFIFAAPESAS